MLLNVHGGEMANLEGIDQLSTTPPPPPPPPTSAFLLDSDLRSRVKVELAVPDSPSLIIIMVSVDEKQHWTELRPARAQELCKSRGTVPGFPSLMVFAVSVDVKQR